jgi:hypothetical protein
MAKAASALPWRRKSSPRSASDASYAAAEKTMGLESLVTLVAAVGAFSMTCITAATFQIDPPADDSVPLAG